MRTIGGTCGACGGWTSTNGVSGTCDTPGSDRYGETTQDWDRCEHYWRENDATE